MNKNEYLEKLEVCLRKRHLSKAEIDDIIRDYAEYFEEGRRQSKPDQEISAKLGDPQLVADQIVEENAQNTHLASIDVKKEWKESKETFRKWKLGDKASGCLTSILKLMAIVLLIPFVIVAALGIAAFLIALWSAFVAMLCAPFAMILVSIVGFFVAAMSIHFISFPVGLLAMFASAALLSFSVCFAVLLLMAARSCFYAAKRMMIYLKARLFPSRKREPEEDPENYMDEEAGLHE